MIKPQNRRRNNNPVVDQARRLLRFHRMLVVFNPTTLLPHLNLAMHHLLVEPQMALTSKQAILQVNPLHRRVLCARPHAHFVVGREQWGGFVRRDCGYLVLVHLV